MRNEKKEIIESFKNRAELFLENDIRVFIKDCNDSYYSCDIVFVGEIYLMIYDFIKKQKFKKYWIDIVLLEEWQTKEERLKMKELELKNG